MSQPDWVPLYIKVVEDSAYLCKLVDAFPDTSFPDTLYVTTQALSHV